MVTKKSNNSSSNLCKREFCCANIQDKKNVMFFKLFSLFLFCFFVNQCMFSQMFDCKKTLTNHFGCCSHITRDSKGKYDFPIRDEELSIYSELKINWCRADLDAYSVMPPKNGAWRPQIFDSVLVSLRNSKTEFLPILDRAYNGKFAWEGIWFEQYLRYVSNRYKNDYLYWEVMNEMDLVKSERTNVYEGYLQALKKSYSVLKESNPKNQVLSTSFCDVEYKLLDYLCENEGYKYWDILNIHSYAIPEELPQTFRKVKLRMDKYGWSSPVWLTECGMSSAQIKKELTNKGFYEEVLPSAIKSLGFNLKDVDIAVVRDGGWGYSALTSSEIDAYLRGICKSVKSVSLNEIGDLAIDDYPFLIVSGSEEFPMKFFNSVVEFVRKGGTIILTKGIPFYYDLQKQSDGNFIKKQVNDAFLYKLHMSALFWWSNKAKKLSVPEVPSKVNSKFSYKWDFSKSRSARFLSAENLKQGDVLVPLITAGNDKFEGVVAGIYKLDSDLKGNIIFQTRLDREPNLRGDREQARRLARIFLVSYAFGIEKVFWYNFRSRESDDFDKESHFGLVHRDLSPKLSLKAYQTLIRFLPEGSTRPIISVNENLYVAHWENTSKKHVYAIWNPKGIQEVNLEQYQNIKVYNYIGEEIKNISHLIVEDEVVFIKSDSLLVFN